MDDGGGFETVCGEMKLDLKPSSNISGASYDPESKELTVRYHHGGAYIYNSVPQSVVDDFSKADSHGQFHHRHLKGRYPGKPA